MTTFDVHTIDSAPPASKPILEATKRALGSIPNLYGVFAESPAVLEGAAKLNSLLEESSAFTATELQVVLLTTSFENECDYCMAAHTAIAGMKSVPRDLIKSLRDGRAIEDPKLEALRVFTRTIVGRRGWVSEQDVRTFLAAGFTKRHLLEVILGVALKTVSNFTNHIAATPVDAQFQRFAWSKPKAEATN